MSERIHRVATPSGKSRNDGLRGLVATIASGLALAPAAPEAEVFSLGVAEVEGEREDVVTAATVERVNLERMRQLDRFDVGSAATALPGVTLQSGGPRGERLLFVRGFESRQVPVFIDGIPVYVPYNGNIDLGRFAANGLARIDVSKAWTSLLYGPNTLGGAVNLVTRRPTDTFEADLRLFSEFDGDLHRSATLGDLFLGTAQDAWYAQATLTGMDRSHFSLPGDFHPVATENGGRRGNSGASDIGLQLRAGWTPNATDEYALSYFNQRGRKETPPYVSGPG